MAKESIKIQPQQIQKGMYIELPILWKDNPFLMRKFKVHFDYQVEIIRKMTIDHIIYYPKKSDAEPLPEVTEGDAAAPAEPAMAQEDLDQHILELEWEKAQQAEKLKEYRSSLQKTEKKFSNTLKAIKDVMNKMGSRPLNAIEEASELINDISDSILGADNLVLHLMNDDMEGENMYYHSLNVTILSLMVAKSAGMEPEEGRKLGMGAMFHDVGKLKIPKKVLLKKEKLNKAEIGLFQLHPKYGVDLLKITKVFPEDVMPIIDQHHEYLDGSGYPYGLKGDKIDTLAQIVAMVNVYDNLCHPSDGRPGLTPSTALSHMYKNLRPRVNENYLNMLIRLLGVYPPGSVVALSDGRVGLVMSVNSEDLLNPDILLYDPEIPRSDALTINLAKTDIKVEKVFKPTQLKPEALEYLSPRSQLNYTYYFEQK